MPSQNLQDAFLNTARKERQPAVIYLTSGVKLTGHVRGFDEYCVVFETNHQEQLIFKHAISTVVTTSRQGSREQPARHSAEPTGEREAREGRSNGEVIVVANDSPGVPGSPIPAEPTD